MQIDDLKIDGHYYKGVEVDYIDPKTFDVVKNGIKRSFDEVRKAGPNWQELFTWDQDKFIVVPESSGPNGSSSERALIIDKDKLKWLFLREAAQEVKWDMYKDTKSYKRIKEWIINEWGSDPSCPKVKIVDGKCYPDTAFSNHLENATKEVSTWPEWKQKLLGGEVVSKATIDDKIYPDPKKSKVFGLDTSEVAKDWYPFEGYIKPDWPTYFITLAFITAQRSIDPNTKHGCIAVDKDNAILSTGYNGPPRGCNDEDVPKTRPDKYLIFTHAEENCIINAARKGISLDGSTFYITGYPCSRCLGKLINAGVRKVVYSNVASACLDEADERIRKVCLGSKNAPEMIEFKDINQLKSLVEQTERYLVEKLEK